MKIEMNLEDVMDMKTEIEMLRKKVKDQAAHIETLNESRLIEKCIKTTQKLTMHSFRKIFKELGFKVCDGPRNYDVSFIKMSRTEPSLSDFLNSTWDIKIDYHRFIDFAQVLMRIGIVSPTYLDLRINNLESQVLYTEICEIWGNDTINNVIKNS